MDEVLNQIRLVIPQLARAVAAGDKQLAYKLLEKLGELTRDPDARRMGTPRTISTTRIMPSSDLTRKFCGTAISSESSERSMSDESRQRRP